MRTLVFAISLVFAMSACSEAQKGEAGQVTTGPMPILGAPETILTCFMDYQDLESRRANCIGQYTEVCSSQRQNQSTHGMTQCASREAQAWTAQLDEISANILNDLDENPTHAFQVAENAWQASRDAHCQFEISIFEGGSISSVIYAGCINRATAERALELIQWHENYQSY